MVHLGLYFYNKRWCTDLNIQSKLDIKRFDGENLKQMFFKASHCIAMLFGYLVDVYWL